MDDPKSVCKSTRATATQLGSLLQNRSDLPDDVRRLLSAASRRLTELADSVAAGSETVLDLVMQFGVRGVKDNRRCIGTAGLSALEDAFRYLGWDDPHFVTQDDDTTVCMAEGCVQWATCGLPTGDGYKWLCSKHWREAKGLPVKVRKRA